MAFYSCQLHDKVYVLGYDPADGQWFALDFDNHPNFIYLGNVVQEIHFSKEVLSRIFFYFLVYIR